MEILTHELKSLQWRPQWLMTLRNLRKYILLEWGKQSKKNGNLYIIWLANSILVEEVWNGNLALVLPNWAMKNTLALHQVISLQAQCSTSAHTYFWKVGYALLWIFVCLIFQEAKHNFLSLLFAWSSTLDTSSAVFTWATNQRMCTEAVITLVGLDCQCAQVMLLSNNNPVVQKASNVQSFQ